MRSVVKAWWRLVRFGFRLLYHELAFTYDIVSKIVSLGAWRCWQRAALKHLSSDGLVLELAHGTGDLQIDLQQAGYGTFAYDLSPQMGRIARRKLRRHGLRADLVRGRAEQLPFPDQSFESVVSTFPTDFIFASQTLHDIHRVLVTGGRLVVVPSGILLGGGLVRRFLEWLYRITGQRNDTGDALMGRVRDHFNAHGFATTIHEEACIRNSVAFVIVAVKTD